MGVREMFAERWPNGFAQDTSPVTATVRDRVDAQGGPMSVLLGGGFWLLAIVGVVIALVMRGDG